MAVTVCSLIPCRRHSSFVGAPASDSFNTPMICSSVKRFPFMELSFPKSLENSKPVPDTFRGAGQHYGFVAELQKALTDDAGDANFLKAAGKAVATYDSQTEAVVIDERTEGIFIVIIGASDTRVIGEFFLAKEQ